MSKNSQQLNQIIDEESEYEDSQDNNINAL
jgi:hypothetical protein